ncbi:MAG: hypothetical protein M0R28_21080 [Pigmentiphaga sp.]|nr:hypothetical protein [Pigmentiphaga sp.]
MSVDNLRRTLDLADRIDRQEGSRSYQIHQRNMCRLALRYGFTRAAVTGAFSALSPNNDFLGNLRSTATLLIAKREGLPCSAATVSTYKACALRAWRCLEGEDFLAFTKGKKTRAFYLNIMDPMDPEPVCVDGHMISCWAGKRLTMKEAVRVKAPYDRIADDVRTVALEQGMIPNQVQAILWFTWKRLHRSKYVGCQLDLFRLGDQWAQEILPDDIQPFPIQWNP